MKVKFLQVRRPDAERMIRLRALFDGGPRWHAIRQDFFPKRPFEPQDVYTERQSLLTYTNHVGGILATLVALLFSEAPTVEGLEGDYYESLLANTDGGGTPWASLWASLLEDALVYKHAWAAIVLPARTGAAPSSLADEVRGGLLDARIARIDPECVLQWGESHGQLTWVLYRSEEATEWAPGQQAERTIRWTWVSRNQVRVWEWRGREGEAPDIEADAAELEAYEHGFGGVPVLRMTLPPNLWAMSRLEDTAVKACRSENELSWALHQAAHELLTISSRSMVDTPRLGHGHYLTLERDNDGTDSAAYVAPTGVAFAHLRAERDADRADLFRAFNTMAQAMDPHSRVQSGLSKEMDWRGTEIMLAGLAEVVTAAMSQALTAIRALRRDGGEPLTIRGLNGWQLEDIQVFMTSVAMATEALDLSPTFRKEVAKRQAERVLGANTTPETINAIFAEIESADMTTGLRFVPPAPTSPAGEKGEVGAGVTDGAV